MEILYVFIIGVIGEAITHIIIKEPARFQVSRLAYNEWRPLKQNSGPVLRYPVYKKIYGPPKKEIYDQNVDGSEQILQQFSPAPPSILGSLNVFGHATVKARQHATTHLAKPTRPVIDTRTYYQNQHKHIAPYLIYKDPPKRSSTQSSNSYKRQPIYSSDDRTPISHYQQAQSTSLASNTYYFDQQPPFIPSIRDHSYEKVRKHPTTDSYNVAYTIPTLDYHGLTFYNANNYQDLYRNPFGDIHLSEVNREHLNDGSNGANGNGANVGSPIDPLYEPQLSIGKPFHHSGGIQSTSKSKGSYSTTSYSALSSPVPPHQPSKLTTIKFSQVAQPFKLVTSKPKFENEYTETVYPLSVTSVDVPEPIRLSDNGNNAFIPSFPKFQSNFYNTTAENSEHTNSKAQSFSSEQPFLPTPATEDSWSNQKDIDELTTIGQQQLYAETTMNGSEDDGTWATVITTVPAPIETTTMKKHKSRRRPNRRPATKVTSERVTEDSITTVDYNKYNRRRKPINKLYTNNDLKRLRSTTTSYTTSSTTTTVAPFIDIVEETTILPNTTTSTIDYITEPIQLTSEIYQQNEPEQNIKDSLNIVKYDEQTTQIPEILHISSSTTTTTTTTEPITTTPATSSMSSLSVKMRMKYGNRPRFSVKDYRERLRTTTSTSTPEINESYRNRTETRTKLRNTSSIKNDKDDNEMTTESKYKFKPRVTPSRYKFSTTTAVNSETTTTERVNSFKPSSNRYKSNGGKYYSRYRTSTASSKEVDENLTTASNSRITIKTKGVFSAKRRPSSNKPKTDEIISIEQSPTEILKIKDNEVIPSSPTISFEGIQNDTSEISSTVNTKEKHLENLDPTGEEAIKIADLTSSSTNEFHQTATMTKFQRRRPTQKISLPRDDPILPLEAFFQTQTKDS